jgi:hypothetical protein
VWVSGLGCREREKRVKSIWDWDLIIKFELIYKEINK